MFNRIKIRSQLLIISAISVLFIVVVGLNSYFSNSLIVSSLNDVYNNNLLPIIQFNSMQAKLMDINANVQNYIAPIDRLQKNRKYYAVQDKFEELETLIEECKKNNLDDVERQLIDVTEQKIQQYKSGVKSVFELEKTKGATEQEIYDEYFKVLDSNMSSLNVILNSLISHSKKNAKNLNDTSIETMDRTNKINTFVVILSVFVLLLTNLIISHFITKPITIVSKELSMMAESEQVDFDKTIEINSKNEIGVLVESFNKIRDKFKKQIEMIKNNQELIIQQEKMVLLGNLMAGIAHNLKTPILAIDSGLESIKKLSLEYKKSIFDEEVTEEDHVEIAKEIENWVEKLKSQTNYMTDVILAVKIQTVKDEAVLSDGFTIDEVFSKVGILMQYELKRRNCKLIAENKTDKNIKIRGSINSLVQILNNLINNAIHSYEGKNGEIELKAYEKENKLCIEVKDYGKGIPLDVQKKLFKESVTTKGKDGTGIGLYISYSSLKAKFNGELKFESEEGKGSTFYILLPLK